MTVIIFFILLGAAVYQNRLPKELLMVYSATSCLTFFLYSHDKNAARKGKWRVRERRLHLLGLFGGWPGALLAQKVLHHKTRKIGFQRLFWLTVIINCAALGWFVHAFQR